MKKTHRKIGVFVCASALSLAAVAGPMGCASTYYSIWEKLGYEKRDILVSRVQAAAESQQKAKEQFKTTMQQFQELTGFNGGDLEAEYNKLKDSYDKCRDRADTVTTKIDKVDEVANAMFTEWAANLDQYSDQGLRNASEQKLNESKARYAQLLAVMRNSEAKMKPVLVAFADRVHFLNDNLNAAAISSLQGTSAGISTDVQNLIADMDASINEANSFIDNMKKT